MEKAMKERERERWGKMKVDERERGEG